MWAHPFDKLLAVVANHYLVSYCCYLLRQAWAAHHASGIGFCRSLVPVRSAHTIQTVGRGRGE